MILCWLKRRMEEREAAEAQAMNDLRVAREVESLAWQIELTATNERERREAKCARERAWLWTTFYGQSWVRSPQFAI